jgi:DNA-binding SARP family transcriptional activator
MKHLELRCFGPPAVLLEGQDPPADVLWRRHLALLVYLALSPGYARTREHLKGVFWPDKLQDRARHSLNEATRRLRAGLGGQRLKTLGETISLNAVELEVDALMVEEKATQTPADAASRTVPSMRPVWAAST